MTSVGAVQVLIVDDNRPMRQLLRGVLRAAGVRRVAEADGALAAFELIGRVPVDLVLVDWKMKPVDGIAFTKMIRLSAESPNHYLPVLMMTAYTEATRVAAARDAGVSGFIKKPISARALLDRIGAAILDQRAFVRTPDFFGPNRRHGEQPGYCGPRRRASDAGRADGVETFEIDDWRCSA